MVIGEVKYPGIGPRGEMLYIKKRVPVRFASVETRKEINTSLETGDPEKAMRRLEKEWDSLTKEWNRLLRVRKTNLLGQDPPDAREAYDAARAVLDDMGLPLCGIDRLVSGPLEVLLIRVEAAAKLPVNSVTVAALLGGLELPTTLISGMPAEFERIREPFLKAKNRVQRRQWRNKYCRAAKAFLKAVGDKSMRTLTDYDADLYIRHWWNRCMEEGITAQYAAKHLSYFEHMVDAYYKDLGVLTADIVNPFRELKLDKTPGEKWRAELRKLALPIWWIRDVLFNPLILSGLNEEARDIAIVCAELGTRENEIYDLPPEAIMLEQLIPHLVLDVVTEGEHKRELKNRSSKRKVPLTPRTLAIMKKYPQGFKRYRNTANYSNTINKFLSENHLFPVCTEDPARTYSIGGLRHGFEDRLIEAGIDNEMRAFMMGHSIKAIRGRPVYGTALELPLHVLLLEKVAFPTDDWMPRSIQEIDAEIDLLFKSKGRAPH